MDLLFYRKKGQWNMPLDNISTDYSIIDGVAITAEGIFDHVLMEFSVSIFVSDLEHQRIVKLCQQNCPSMKLEFLVM
ncbi:Uncharacterized protein TCM_040176 [Theobroma cacao]|uniref:Uncharacterized protein n=1 Tax=Theobroma cacao TaxID=3641 RepID=A0A061GSF9_THECC|nr:Uncharacterized protein TCM_040176 [Theobroma cacao]